VEYVAMVTGLILLQLFWFSLQVAKVREAHECPAPAMTGPPEFERAYRVHMNTIEQLVILIPSMWMFAYFVRPDVAAGLGIVFLVGRLLYRNSYLADPSSRTIGFMVGFLAMMIMLVGSMIGAGMTLI
jgi:glutathione S-transferase